MNAKEIVKNKFWIVQDKGQNIGGKAMIGGIDLIQWHLI